MQEWIFCDAVMKTISKMDVALCNRDVRWRWWDKLQNLRCNEIMTERLFHCWDCSYFSLCTQFLSWTQQRALKIRSILLCTCCFKKIGDNQLPSTITKLGIRQYCAKKWTPEFEKLILKPLVSINHLDIFLPRQREAFNSLLHVIANNSAKMKDLCALTFIYPHDWDPSLLCQVLSLIGGQLYSLWVIFGIFAAHTSSPFIGCTSTSCTSLRSLSLSQLVVEQTVIIDSIAVVIATNELSLECLCLEFVPPVEASIECAYRNYAFCRRLCELRFPSLACLKLWNVVPAEALESLLQFLNRRLQLLQSYSFHSIGGLSQGFWAMDKDLASKEFLFQLARSLDEPTLNILFDVLSRWPHKLNHFDVYSMNNTSMNSSMSSVLCYNSDNLTRLALCCVASFPLCELLMRCTMITDLSLTCCNHLLTPLTNGTIRCPLNLINIRRLFLSTEMTGDGLKLVQYCPSLAELTIHYCPVLSDFVFPLLEKYCSRLQKLRITACRLISMESMQSFATRTGVKCFDR